MKLIHKILLGLVAATALAIVPSASAHDHHHRHCNYVNYNGVYGYYYGPRFYAYNAGPYPYYYGPFSPPAPAVVVTPRRHHVFIFF